jgi:succinoglycan biosynthesis protein ExoA
VDPAEAKGAPPTVTVVLPVRNEGAHITAVLADVLGQETGGASFEVLVVDGRSTDDTRARVEAVARTDARVRLLDNPLRLSSAARARGVAEARGRYIAFVDGHCRLPSRALLRDMVDLFEETGAWCLARPQPLTAGTPGYVARAVSAARSSRFGHSLASTIYDDRDRQVSPVSAGAMYRREVFERVGTFDPAFDACEDVEFNWRVEQAGLACWTSKRLAVAYEPRATLRGLFRQMLRYGRGRARLHRKHPTAATRETWVPALFVLGLPLLALLPFLPTAAALLVAAPYALYGALALCASVVAAGARGWALLPILPIVFFVIHAGLGLGYLLGRFERWPRPPAPEAP